MAKNEDKSYGAVDGGWGWIIVFACFLAHVIIDGIFYSFGILFVEFLDHFKQGRGDTAWITSIASAVPFLIGPIAGVLTNRYGCRVVTIIGGLTGCLGFLLSACVPNMYFLFFSLGGLVGCGYGLVYFASIVCVTVYFEKRRSLATGLVVCGSGVGAFIFNPLSAALIENYGMKGTLVIEAGIMLNCVVIGALYRPINHKKTSKKKTRLSPQTLEKYKIVSQNEDSPGNKTDICDVDAPDNDESCKCVEIEDQNKETGERDNSCGRKKGKLTWLIEHLNNSLHLRLLRNIPFLINVIIYFIYGLFNYIPYIYIADFAREKDIPVHTSAWLLSIIGIANIVGSALFGPLADRKWLNRFLLYGIVLVICGTSTAILPFLETFEGLIGFAVVFGLFSGVDALLASVILVDLVGLSYLTEAFGICNLCSGLSSLIGTPLAGWLFDGTGSYLVSFLSSGTAIVFSGILYFLIMCMKKSRDIADNNDICIEV